MAVQHSTGSHRCADGALCEHGRHAAREPSCVIASVRQLADARRQLPRLPSITASHDMACNRVPCHDACVGHWRHSWRECASSEGTSEQRMRVV